MCLIVDTMKPRPTKPINVWKVVTINEVNELHSIHYNYRWSEGEHVVLAYNKVSTGIPYSYGWGVFHGYTTREVARQALKKVARTWQQYRVIKLIGQPEDWKAYGICDDVCFTRLTMPPQKVQKYVN